MTPTRWQEIERIYHAATEHASAERVAFLTEACKDDPELRREVETLLAQDASTTGTLDCPAWDEGIVAPGTQLGPYQVEGLLGKGGMGEVYRARDTRLDREVAIKVLPRSFATADAERRRFQREARAASALNHPNICAIYDVGDSAGHPFLVMELLDGKTLREHIRGKPLEVAAALALGIQVADALDAAHGKGIIHRDIKPANIFVTARHQAKVLGLRPGETERASRHAGKDGDGAHRAWRGHGYGRLHVSGAGPRPECGCADRSVVLGCCSA